MLIATILAGGLEFATVSAGALGLKVTRAYGMHALVWAVFIYYLYVYSVVRRSIISQLDRMKNEKFWINFASWLAQRHFRADLEAAAGRSLKNVGLNYNSDTEDIAGEKKVGNTSITHVDFSLTVEMEKQLLDSGLFSKSDKHEGWIQHTCTVTNEDVQEFDSRRGYALAKNELVWVEYRLPYIGAWILLAVGIVIYAAWILYPESWLGHFVPLDPLTTKGKQLLSP